MLGGLAAGFIWVVATAPGNGTTRLAIDENDAFGAFWFSLGLCLTLPSMAVAWADEQV